jgi:Zn-dependent M32 family carboxypeptidase
MSEQQLEKAIKLGAMEMLRKQTAEMTVSLLEKSLSRLKIETDEKYDTLWKRYTKEKEQYEITIAHLNRMLELEKQLCKHIVEREQLKDDRRKVIDEKFDELLNKLKEGS